MRDLSRDRHRASILPSNLSKSRPEVESGSWADRVASSAEAVTIYEGEKQMFAVRISE